MLAFMMMGGDRLVRLAGVDWNLAESTTEARRAATAAGLKS